MGQQQLLLIILGVIIVGIAVAVGISMFTASATSANRDAVSSDLTNLASLAQQHYRRPAALGGGAQSFDGSTQPGVASAWTIPGQLDTTANGTYVATLLPQTLTLVGTGVEPGDNGTTPVRLTCTVTPIQISTVKNN